MFPLLETIRFENGDFSNIAFHVERMERSLKECFDLTIKFKPLKVLEQILEENKWRAGLFKFRFLYNDSNFYTEFVPYTLPDIKLLKPVISNNIQYRCKYSDRSALNNLALKKEEADDIIIIKNGLVTDTSFANIVFFENGKWFTPSAPLLKGTQRAKLLEERKIIEKRIKFEDIFEFSEIRIINAMIRLEDKISVIVKKG